MRALVPPGSDASRLEAKVVEIARGDMLDLDLLVRAMEGAYAVITTAAGYTRARKNAHRRRANLSAAPAMQDVARRNPRGE